MHSITQLNWEKRCLLKCAQMVWYVTVDRRDEYDRVALAYQQWCREERVPYLEVALGDETSRVIYSLIEADMPFSEQTESLLRKRLPVYCLYDGEIEIEDDYCIAARVCNEQISALLAWLRELTDIHFSSPSTCKEQTFLARNNFVCKGTFLLFLHLYSLGRENTQNNFSVEVLCKGRTALAHNFP